MNHEWKIKARAHSCAVTGEPFREDEPFFTALFEDDSEEGFTRRDYSVAAWKQERAQLKPFSYWRSIYEAPKADPGKKDVVEKESAESLLRRLIEEDDPSTENARFILALMLERKKTLKEVETRHLGGSMLRIYEHRSGDVFIIRDPLLKLTEIDSLQQEVAELLGASESAAVTNAEAAQPAPTEAASTTEGDTSAPEATDSEVANPEPVAAETENTSADAPAPLATAATTDPA